MIVWADAEKFALWEPYLPVPKICLKREKSGSSDTALPQTSSPVTAYLLPAGQSVAPQVTPVHPTSAPLTESCAQPIEATRDPSVGSEWSGFPDDLEEPFPDLFSDLDLAPPVSALNPSQKHACSPEPPGRPEPVEPNAPVSLPANDQSGFSAEQLANHQGAHTVLFGASDPFFAIFRIGPFVARSGPHYDACVRHPASGALLGFRSSATDNPSYRTIWHPAFSVLVSATWSFLGFRPSSRRGNRGVDWCDRVGSSVRLGGRRRGHSACGSLPP